MTTKEKHYDVPDSIAHISGLLDRLLCGREDVVEERLLDDLVEVFRQRWWLPEIAPQKYCRSMPADAHSPFILVVRSNTL